MDPPTLGPIEHNQAIYSQEPEFSSAFPGWLWGLQPWLPHGEGSGGLHVKVLAHGRAQPPLGLNPAALDLPAFPTHHVVQGHCLNS